MGSTGMESSILGMRAMFTAKGVSRAMQSRPVSKRTTKRSSTRPAKGRRER